MLFEFINLKIYPQVHEKEVELYLDLHEHFELQDFMLDNKLGMQEKVPNLVVAEVIFKDKDRVLLVYSGFATMNNLNIEQAS